MSKPDSSGAAQTFRLPLHSSIALDCRQVNPAVALEVRRALAGYSEAVAMAPNATEIVVAPLGDARPFHEQAWRRKNPEPWWVQLDRGDPIAVYRNRQRAGVVIRLGEHLAVEYDEQPAVAKRVVDGIYFALHTAVHRRGALLFKGAVLLRHDRAVALIGRSGAGKTSLLLQLLADGWSYLSDDLFLLVDGEAFGLRRYMAFNHHHVLAMPEIFRGARLTKPRPARWRARLRRICVRTLPISLLRIGKLKRIYDPSWRADPVELFPRCQVVTRAVPMAWVLLRPGQEAALRLLPTDVAVRRAVAAQHQLLSGSYLLAEELEIAALGKAFDIGPLVERSFGSTPCWELVLPEGVPPRPLYDLVRPDLERLACGEQTARAPERLPAG